MSTSSQVYPPAFKIYRHRKPNKCGICRDKCEDHDWNGGIGSYQPLLDDDDDEPAPPPYIVLVQGPPNVGKSLMIKSLIKHYTEQHMIDDIQGPITIRTGIKRRRLQFVECPDDINGMIDAAKYADIVLLLVYASHGFEAETFEFLSLLRVHGLPKVMGVLTHLDHFKDDKELNETIERLQDHFRTEICEGATMFHLSGLNDFELYKMLEVQKLAEAITMLQLHTPSWRAEHPYVLVDRFEDVTPPRKLHKDANCKRNISLCGYLRGCTIKSGVKVHIAGVGDFCVASITSLADPFPLSSEMEVERDLIGITHMDMGSFRTGTYLRLEVHDVPFGMVENLNPCHPILVGGISLEVESVGYIQARLKRHNWHMRPIKPLKSSWLETLSDKTYLCQRNRQWAASNS
ncbi:ribosome biogenesis protein BMS1 homolog [Papaver somniferum]|uniref:ribosome biogenesis protein BMS1 homolog n=1 Tax=Papaver somniferum TaxID=3469 RepID=UPI000E6FD80D|nr:ribosome biogenesis protein BMS1 homolog [Papaver somniferum]